MEYRRSVEVWPSIVRWLSTHTKVRSPAQSRRCGGLGLALCRDLIEENQGAIRVSSTPGESTTFTITLPALPTTIS